MRWVWVAQVHGGTLATPSESEAVPVPAIWSCRVSAWPHHHMAQGSERGLGIHHNSWGSSFRTGP